MQSSETFGILTEIHSRSTIRGIFEIHESSQYILQSL